MNMYKALVISELIEIIFVFLSRKDLYRSCTRVNRQWNALSMLVIQKKRKNEFISIPHIRDNIIFHLYDNHHNITEIVNYSKVSEIWRNILNRLYAKTISLSMLYNHQCFLNSSHYSRRRLLCNKRRLICHFTSSYTQYYLKHDYELNRYYQDILSLYDVRAEFLRLSRICRAYEYTEDEFRRQSRVIRSIEY